MPIDQQRLELLQSQETDKFMKQMQTVIWKTKVIEQQLSMITGYPSST